MDDRGSFYKGVRGFPVYSLSKKKKAPSYKRSGFTS